MSISTKLFGLVCAVLILAAVLPSRAPQPQTAADSSQSAGSQRSAQIAPSTAGLSRIALTHDERVRLVEQATKHLRKERDKLEKTTFYVASGDGLRTQVGAYFGIADGGSPYLRMKTVYYGDRWIFYNAVKIMADDDIVYEKTFDRREITRDNASRSVWEVGDYVASVSDQRALERISKAKDVTVRFTGRDRIHDHTMTAAQKAGLKSVLTAYVELKEKL